MTNEEFERATNFNVAETLEIVARGLTPDGTVVTDADYAAFMTTLRTWRSGLRNSMDIRKARADKGKERT
jgi:hypothetical protein